jgi:hypothetical protein
MRRLSSTQGRTTDRPPPDSDRKSVAIAAMGYRLAAAGPRTRQRLIERETTASVLPEPRRAEPRVPPQPPQTENLPTLASWDDTLWEQRLAADAALGMARLSARHDRFPVWRTLALLTSAACGFSLVLFGQSLHLDRKLRLPNHDSRPALRAETQPPPPPDQSQPAAAQAPAAANPVPPQPAPLPVQARGFAQAALQPSPSPVNIPQPDPASSQSPAPPPQIRHAAQPNVLPRPFPAQPTIARQQPRHPPTRPVFASSGRTPRPTSAEPTPHATHHDLPRWLTENRPEHKHDLIMSPPPHNLDAPQGAELAANTPAPAPANDMPPIPQPGRRPALIYAEAHTTPPPATGWAAPRPTYNANPYYAPYPNTNPFYGALPPPTPYYQP